MDFRQAYWGGSKDCRSQVGFKRGGGLSESLTTVDAVWSCQVMSLMFLKTERECWREAMGDARWDGKPQKTTLPNGVPKSLQLVLEGRGVNTWRMNAHKMRKILKQWPQLQKWKALNRAHFGQGEGSYSLQVCSTFTTNLTQLNVSGHSQMIHECILYVHHHECL